MCCVQRATVVVAGATQSRGKRDGSGAKWMECSDSGVLRWRRSSQESRVVRANCGSSFSTKYIYLCLFVCLSSIEMLVRAGVDVNQVSNNGWSPLKDACESGRTVVAECLLRCGARMDEEWEGDDWEDERRLRAEVIESMGGPEGVLKAHAEWLVGAPGRRTKAAR